MKSQSIYIAFGAMTVAVNIALMALIGKIPAIGSYACCLPSITITLILTEFGWKKAIPVYLATALLGFLVLPGGRAALYACTGFHCFLIEICHAKSYWNKKWISACILVGIITGVLIVPISTFFGLTIPHRLGIFFVPVICILVSIYAILQGILYKSTRDNLYVPLIRPYLKNYF